MTAEADLRIPYTSDDVSHLPICDRVGLSIRARNPSAALGRIQEAERAGVRQIWMTADSTGSDTLTFYGSAAAQTTSIRLGTAIVPIYPRHPLVMAQQVTAISDIAPRRLRLGIGISHQYIMGEMYGLSMPSPLTYLREYISVLRDLIWNGCVDHHSRFFNVKFRMNQDERTPILIAALGTKAFRMAGEISDGAISWMCPPSYLLGKAIPALKVGARLRNRPTPPLVAHVPIALSSDEVKTRAALHKLTNRYAKVPYYAHMFAASGMSSLTRDTSGRDETADSLMVAGNETIVRERILALLASGLDELLLMLVPIASEEHERKQLLHLIGSL